MTLGKVLITNPFTWGKKFYKGDTLKSDEEIRDYYVWGANSYNYNYRKGKILGYTDRLTGEKKGGSGMASAKGPTRGRAHPNFIGIISIFKPGDNMEEITKINAKQFRKLYRKLLEGHNVIFPLDMDRFTEKNVPKMSKGSVYDEFVTESHGLGKGVSLKRAEESENPQDLINWQNVQGTIFDGIYNTILYNLEQEKQKQKPKSKKVKRT